MNWVMVVIGVNHLSMVKDKITSSFLMQKILHLPVFTLRMMVVQLLMI